MNRLDKIAALLLQSLDDAAEEEVSEPSKNPGELPSGEPFDGLEELTAEEIDDRCDETMRPLEVALDKVVANARALLKAKAG